MKVRRGYTLLAATLVSIIPSIALAQKPSYNTPGAKTKATEAEVCAPDYAASVKDVASYQRNEALKRYGRDPSSFNGDLDHLIPVSLGGSNEPDNLWPMPDNKEYGVTYKRDLEKTLHQMVCDKKISLKDAQNDIKKDWVKAYDKYVKSDAQAQR